jgi:Na+-driven multidrug efflux pump
MLLDEISNDIAGKMVLYTTISIFFNSTFLLSRSMMNARHSFNNQLVSTLVSSGFHIIVCIFLFKYCEFTVYGAVIAKIITDIFNINFFMWLTQLKQELVMDHFRTMKLIEVVELGRTIMPRGLVMTLEILAYEAFTFQTVSLANEQISSHIIATNMHNIGYFIFTGISVVTYLKVSKYIINHHRKSIEYVKSGAIILLVIAVVFLFAVVYAPWRHMFTN